MKKIMFAAVVLLSLAVRTQAQESGRTFPDKQVVAPYNVEVTFSKTLHILFPSEVKYVDLGSTDIIAGIVEGAGNVVRVKAAVRGFNGETNFSVITSDGSFYSFDAVYNENPAQLNIEMEDWLRKDPFSGFAGDRMYIRLKELGGETPLVVNRIMYTIHKRNARDIRSIGSKKFGMEASVRGIFIHNELIFIHTLLRNHSRVSFNIDYIRFRIADKKIVRRTALQETFVEPVRTYNDIVTVDGKSGARNVFAFTKFTIPDDKVLVMEIYEKNGGRHQSFVIENTDLVGAKAINELKLK